MISLAAGAILGVVCILGAWLRSAFEPDAVYLFSFWYNRVLLGVVIGVAGEQRRLAAAIGRGALLGLLVSFAFYSSTAFLDPIGFLAGIIYGILIEYVAWKYGAEVIESD